MDYENFDILEVGRNRVVVHCDGPKRLANWFSLQRPTSVGLNLRNHARVQDQSP